MLKSSLKFVVYISLLSFTALLPALAYADFDHGRGERHDFSNHWRNENSYYGRDRVIVEEAPRDRVIIVQQRNAPRIRDYYNDQFGSHCPPGLARQGRCVPERHVTYVYGDVLPSNVVYEEVPANVIVERPPSGYRYVRIDDNVLLIDATRHIIGAISLIDAAN